ncbi:MAG TPA: A/G-specific adenine glycosylase [Sphingomicrobium sp.]
MTANAAKCLIQHYVDNYRRLPWRAPPGEGPPDPYRVWLSEIMLQQTTVATIIPRFERFLERWPTFAALARASDADILSEWAGLGYYARARNLIACAREVAKRGGFPTTAAELRQLPGIGAYTSAAIAAIAFDERVAAIDTNVERVIARLYGFKTPRRAEIEKLALEMMPEDRPGDFTQAMMDLGATICRPKAPRCAQCPLQSACLAFASGEPAAFPHPRRPGPRPHKYGVAYWIERDCHVWLVRRPAKGLLGGMAALPGSGWSDEALPIDGFGSVRHVFTHFSLDLIVAARSEPIGEGWWQPLDQLAQAGLPTLYRRAAELALAARDEPRRAA